MFDFEALPPTTNSTRMYSGPGAAPIVAAAAAWSTLAKELSQAARGLRSVIDTLMGSFDGVSAQALAVRVELYAQWLTLTAQSADETATQLMKAASAYETAKTSMVPPLAAYANRAQVVLLSATNIFGLNTDKIAAKELEYAQMWAQDVQAMMLYQNAVLEARTATLAYGVFGPAPGIINQLGEVDESVAAFMGEELLGDGGELLLDEAMNATSKLGGASKLGQQFNVATPKTAVGASSVAAPTKVAPTKVWGGLGTHLGPMSNVVSMANNHVGMANTGLSMVNGASSMFKGLGPTAAQAAQAVAEGGQALENALGSMGRGALGSGLGGQVTAGMGKAASMVGSLRVPEAWSAANHALSPAVHSLPLTSMAAAAEGVESASTAPMMGGVPMGPMASGMGGGVGTVNNVFKTPTRGFKMFQNLSGG